MNLEVIFNSFKHTQPCFTPTFKSCPNQIMKSSNVKTQMSFRKLILSEVIYIDSNKIKLSIHFRKLIFFAKTV